MGQTYNKQEEKEVIISQNAIGDNGATGTAADHLQANNILLSIFLAVLGIGMMIFIFKFYKKCHSKWIRKEIQSDFMRRIQSRLSGRGLQRDQPKGQEDV
ncbi:hypothetical protein B5X24_HaOG203522 [Helicoverpa armigera]|uniref:Uncharacterized protein n=1 Tax=Helicoverpa armigera TaxID=29058 RepID=A0A2W1BZU9_HELAM|nr:hypothetical protein B5X24_HaOG203521 [Helicoverpa armigera]PZC77363.1 hypothetical protein B5X24_HaOG203522 [Helicoverpa armigera]